MNLICKQSLVFLLFGAATICFVSCKDDPISKIGTNGFHPFAAYNIGTIDPNVGPQHNSFLHYFWDSVGTASSFNSLSSSVRAARFHHLLFRFLIDSTNIDTTMLNIDSTYISQLNLATNVYTTGSAVRARCDSIVTAMALSSDEDSACRAVIDTLYYESDNTTRTSSLNSMYTAWSYKWANIDNYGTNGNHDIVLGGFISVAIYSNAITVGGGIGGDPSRIADIADIAGFAIGYSSSSATTQRGKIVDGAKMADMLSSIFEGFPF